MTEIEIGANEKVVAIAKKLQGAGFNVRPVGPPTVAENTARLRLSLNSNLDENILSICRKFENHFVINVWHEDCLPIKTQIKT